MLFLLERLIMLTIKFISVNTSSILIRLTPFREKDCGLNLSALTYRLRLFGRPELIIAYAAKFVKENFEKGLTK